MRRAPARPVRACFVWSCCTDVVQEHDLRTTPAQCNAKRLLSSHFILHSSHFTLAPHTPHFISSQIMWTLLTSSQLFSSHPISSHMSCKKVLLNCFHLIRALINLSHLLEVVLNSSQRFCAPESSYCQREVSYTKKNDWAQTLSHTEAWDTDAFTQKSLYKILCTTKLAQSNSQYYFVLQSLHKALPSTTLYYEACTKHFPVLLCTAKLAQSTSMYYFVPQSLHKVLPSTTL